MSDLLEIVTLVSQGQTDIVHQAISEAGGGRIGEYSYCSFSYEEVALDIYPLLDESELPV